MPGCSVSSLPGAAGPWALLACLALASVPAGAGQPPAGAAGGLVFYAEGPSFTVIRGDELRTGTRGAALQGGDIVETGSDGFMVVQMQGGSLVGIGPGSSVYFTERSGTLRLLVREGWVKADFRAKDAHGTLAAARLAIQCQKDVVVLYASASRDEIFEEQGEGMLAQRGPALPHTDPQMHPGQLITSDNRMEVVVTPRPSADFLQGMPKPFRDALPPADAASGSSPGTQMLRKVTYGDVEGWLNAQPDWRDGFVGRFRGRLKDPAFFAAMDAHLSQHPEWTLILHPPPPPKIERRPAAGRADAQRSSASGDSADDDEPAGKEPVPVDVQQQPPPNAQPPALPAAGAQPPAVPPGGAQPSALPAAGAQPAAQPAAQPPAQGAQPAAAAPRPPDRPPEGQRPQSDTPSDGRRPQT